MICNPDIVFLVFCDMEQKSHSDISCSFRSENQPYQNRNLLKIKSKSVIIILVQESNKNLRIASKDRI